MALNGDGWSGVRMRVPGTEVKGSGRWSQLPFLGKNGDLREDSSAVNFTRR